MQYCSERVFHALHPGLIYSRDHMPSYLIGLCACVTIPQLSNLTLYFCVITSKLSQHIYFLLQKNSITYICTCMHSNDSTKCYTYIGIIYIVLKLYSNHSDTIGLWLDVPQTRQTCESVTQRQGGG